MKILKFLFLLLIRPYAGLGHFVLYYNFVVQIHLHHNPLAIKVVHTLNCIFLFQALHCVYRFQLGDRSTIQIIVQFRFEYLFLNRIWVELLSLLAHLVLIYYNRGIFIKTKFSLVELLYELLIKKGRFLRIRGATQRKSVRRDSLKNVHTIQKSYLCTLNIFLNFLLPIGKGTN